MLNPLSVFSDPLLRCYRSGLVSMAEALAPAGLGRQRTVVSEEDVLELGCAYLGSTGPEGFESFIESHTLLREMADSTCRQTAVKFVWRRIVNVVRTREEPAWTTLTSAASDRARLDKLECEVEASNKRQRVPRGRGQGADGHSGAESTGVTIESDNESEVGTPRGLKSHTHARD
jgi:hypothetical protein